MRGATRCHRTPPFGIIFQSTLPVRGATRSLCAYANSFPISIHAPRAGSDSIASPRICHSGYFNPRSPCGERHPSFAEFQPHRQFQSTLPVRGATNVNDYEKLVKDFNPRSPCGERRYARGHVVRRSMISIHAPRAGSDAISALFVRKSRLFQSTLPVRGATNWRTAPCPPILYFNPRSPCGERPAACAHTPTASRFQSTLPVRGATPLAAAVI